MLLGLAGVACCSAFDGHAMADTFQRGLVSLTYDDGLDSQLERAVPALDGRGLRGTFYVTWENIEARAAEWRAIAALGHELANHTMTHPCSIESFTASRYRKQVEALERRLEQWQPTLPARDFSYPCDVTDLGPGSPNRELRRFKHLLQREGIASARTSEGPPNSANWARRHPYRLQALAAGYDAPTLEELLAYVRQAQRDRKWAIIVFHDVGPGAEAGEIAQDVHERLLDAIVQEKIPVLRVCDVIGARERRTAETEVK